MKPAAMKTRVSVSLVTYEQFVRFIREEGYFAKHFWDPDVRRSDFWAGYVGRPEMGGDQVLRRIGFCWERRGQPIVGVSWYEADAYCRFEGGRLPWRHELRAHRKGMAYDDLFPEWCGDWFHPKADGPKVLPEPPLRRCVEGWEGVECAAPETTGERIGFRIVL